MNESVEKKVLTTSQTGPAQWQKQSVHIHRLIQSSNQYVSHIYTGHGTITAANCRADFPPPSSSSCRSCRHFATMCVCVVSCWSTSSHTQRGAEAESIQTLPTTHLPQAPYADLRHSLRRKHCSRHHSWIPLLRWRRATSRVDLRGVKAATRWGA